MKKRDYIYLIIIIVMGIILYLRGCEGSKEVKDLEQTYKYKTDTIYSEKGYDEVLTKLEGLEKKMDSTPPKEVIYYQTPNPKNITVDKIPDSIILLLDSLKSKISVSDKYIKNFPKADKLIDFDLEQDRLKITTLGIKGTTTKKDYPLYLQNFKYHWENNRLKRLKRKKPYKYGTKNKWKNLYLSPGYRFIKKHPELRLDYSLRFNRFKIQTDLGLYFPGSDVKSFGSINLGYRLLK